MTNIFEHTQTFDVIMKAHASGCFKFCFPAVSVVKTHISYSCNTCHTVILLSSHTHLFHSHTAASMSHHSPLSFSLTKMFTRYIQPDVEVADGLIKYQHCSLKMSCKI